MRRLIITFLVACLIGIGVAPTVAVVAGSPSPGPGCAIAYLTNAERQAILEGDMLPVLPRCHAAGPFDT